MNVVEFPGIKLEVYGVRLQTGATVLLGTVPLENPDERKKTTESILAGIEGSRLSQQMVTMANLIFDPMAFDYFIVK